ncbi:MAG: ADP-ribose pyrophosphatase YjhB (NUDIX family) [Flavobacteriales bacterium]|jgi:8-oxo-dGTP diphosphatase
MKMNRFNVRGYMLVIQEGCLLLSDEVLQGDYATKFPGGGLEYGEGLIECILREAQEELGQEVEILNHFYTTDFCQPSVFRPEDQMISVYYTAKLKSEQTFHTSEKPFDFVRFEEREEAFRWKKINDLLPSEMTFPIDQVVVRMLRETHLK